MKKFLLYIVLSVFVLPSAKAQYGFKDMVELTGVIMSADSLRYLPFVSIKLPNGEGTRSNIKGVFSVIVPKGVEIEFSCQGYKKRSYTIPDTLSVTRYSVIQLMVQDTFYLPTTIIRPMMTREEFERAFVKWDIPPDQIEMARRNTEANTIRTMAYILPKDGAEHLDYYQYQDLKKSYWAGGQPPMTIFNPLNWAEFFKAWKRGDFKKH